MECSIEELFNKNTYHKDFKDPLNELREHICSYVLFVILKLHMHGKNI